MKILKAVIIICFIGISFSCLRKEKSVVTEINPEIFEHQNIYVSSIGTSIQYIRLNSEYIFQSIISFDSSDSLFFICVRPEGQLLVYNKDGEYKKMIGTNGRGPGEYRYAMNFCLDRKNKRVFILTQQKIILYSFNGEFIKEFTISKYNTRFDAIQYLNNHIYLFENIKMGYSIYNWLVLDTTGNQISFNLNNIPKFNSRQIPLNDITFKHGNLLFYWNQFNDTIYQIMNKNHSAAFLFSKGNFRITPTNRDNDYIYYNECFRPSKIIKTNNFFIIKYAYRKNWGLAVLNSNNKFVTYELNNSVTDIGIINDIDGGYPFDPQQYMVKNQNEFLISWTDAYKLKTYLKSEAFQSSTPKYPEKKKELERLANSLDENDNPVLMLVKLKN